MQAFTENAITKDSIDISGFKPKDSLNTKIWNNMHLNQDVRTALLQIAYNFMKAADFDICHDIIMTGSLANYNWNEEYSDIDLHIVVDFNDISDDPDIAKLYFDEKKSNWNNTHNKISVFGYPVELYVQDKDEPHKSTGVYSLIHDEWIEKPDLDKLPDTSNKEQIVDGVTAYSNIIDTLEDTFEKCQNDKAAVQEILGIANKLYAIIKQERKESLSSAKYPELTTGNLLFKSLRRNGSIKKLINLRTDCFDILHSI